MSISVIAQGLKLLTLQGIALQGDALVVPTLEGTLVRISPQGQVTPLVNFLSANLGIPFAITAERNSQGNPAQDNALIVTVTGYLPDHYLVRVKPDGTYAKITDLTQICTEFGAPFGVAVYQQNYVVTLSTDVAEAVGQIVRVGPDGTISQPILLDGRGNPFGIAVQTDEFVVAQSKRLLLRVTQTGKVSTIVDLQQAGFGIPFFVAVWNTDLVITTNLGWVVKLDSDGKIDAIVNVRAAKYGIPSGIAVYQNDLIVTTNSGYVLRLSP
ncbi:MAG: hypothetical protein KME13_25215 [Myxacorys californica WJT36-NPBG1]|nr:hypothetical protein [Myxacorys californica WJT36-NPBG1]